MVRIHPDPPKSVRGAVAQLGEHLLCKQGVVGSIPSSSTNPGITYRLRTRAALASASSQEEAVSRKLHRSLTIRKARRLRA